MSSASLLVEHFPHGKTLDFLDDWRGVLGPGGRLTWLVRSAPL